MARESMRGNARSLIAARQLLISFIATGSIWGLLGAGAARGQDFVPAPPDFERAKDDGKPVFAAKPPAADAEADVPDQSDVPGRLKRAGVAMMQGRYEEALGGVNYVIGQDSKNSDALVLRALCRMRLGLALDDSLLDAELCALDSVLERTPSAGWVRAVRGALLASKGDLDRAIADLSYAIEHQAASIQAYYHRGLARMWKTDYKEAVDDFNQAAGRCAPSQIPAQILTRRGQCYAACGDLDRAIADFSAVIERYPKEFGPYRLRARAYAEKKDLDHALADHDQIVRLRPDDPGVYLERSFVRLNRGDNAGAMSDMDRFVQLNPRSFGAYFCRAAMSILSGQGDDCSLADLNRAIALEPGFALSYAFRGYLRARKLMYAPAFSDFALAIRRLALLEPFYSIEGIHSERGKFLVGLKWNYKNDQAHAKPKTNASNVEGQCIELATHSLLAAAFGPPR